eukprot:CAMPEP_0172840250 /NCGR_PEP_ID=MMETSP1075-20121228/29169_1 /TAXON_ID=2916 /ORGANISM="Ceratium fusus, Strain PA161109" /LENGTH=41 /DNA_ID= /DNA_START= /DNA_END= /DNA_ORIENTATION=
MQPDSSLQEFLYDQGYVENGIGTVKVAVPDSDVHQHCYLNT